MGCCCPKEEEDEEPLVKTSQSEAEKSPNSRKKKQTGEVNPFKPGARDVRLVQNEDGKLEKTTYKPPADPSEALSREPA